MRAYQVLSFSSPPELGEVPVPAPQSGEVLVRIAACGLNFADLLMAEGKYQERTQPPFTLGMEFAGTVAAPTAPEIGLPEGTRVAAFTGQGGLADYAAVPENRLVPVPPSMGLEEAAAFQVAYGTSHLALARRARLEPGETLLVTGAAGGVGLTAVEIGKAMGARVIAVARGAGKLEIARRAGADVLIDADEDLRARVLAEGGADVVYDVVGGEVLTAAMRATRPEARILTIGFASGEVPKIAANHLLVKNLSVIGVYWGGYLAFRPEALADSLKELFDWHAQGRLRPHIGLTLPLERAGDGLEALRARRTTGKVVVRVSDPAVNPA